ncbi:hypothetical protein [Frigoriglobus tundricola]|uniref:Uncharacterized protein n=1 Tax=Frigoriglobus tundricola TaxID=2774151 RepID=A0A6M5YLK7_9BACT|nr:hypothetical protein [Frigoriglobus tundricola]QJW94196.1 hypothetical protein FTUN_1715 [Frigoriglobus tundricola]
MTVEQMSFVAEYVKARIGRLNQALQAKLADLLDEDQPALEQGLNALLLAELVPEPWNPAWDM